MGSESKKVFFLKYGKNSIVKELEELLVRAKKGEIISLLYFYEEIDAFYSGRVNMNFSDAVMLTARLQHRMNIQWDESL